MNTTILTDEQIVRILEENRPEYDGPDKAIEVSRAIERAVLQSEQVQAWKRDAKRMDWLESCEDSHGFCHAGHGDYIYYAHQVTGMPSVREVIDAAIRSNKNDT